MAFPDSVVPRLLEGRLDLITGAGQDNGATDMKGSTVEEPAPLVRHEGGDAWSFALYVTSAAACEALAGHIETEIGRIDECCQLRSRDGQL